MEADNDYKDWIVGWQRQYHGADVFFYEDLGYVSYKIDFVEDTPYAISIDFYSRHHGRTLYRKFMNYLGTRKVKFLMGHVDITKTNAEEKALIFLYYGGKIIRVEDNIITFKKDVYTQEDWELKWEVKQEDKQN